MTDDELLCSEADLVAVGRRAQSAQERALFGDDDIAGFMPAPIVPSVQPGNLLNQIHAAISHLQVSGDEMNGESVITDRLTGRSIRCFTETKPFDRAAAEAIMRRLPEPATDPYEIEKD